MHYVSMHVLAASEKMLSLSRVDQLLVLHYASANEYIQA
jgi:hypothetical protein